MKSFFGLLLLLLFALTKFSNVEWQKLSFERVQSYKNFKISRVSKKDQITNNFFDSLHLVM